MSEYTPTTEIVRREYSIASERLYTSARRGEFQAEFDRWYDAEKAKWQAEALREFADDPDTFATPPADTSPTFDRGMDYGSDAVLALARERADRIEKGE
jgi:hypothetical protein